MKKITGSNCQAMANDIDCNLKDDQCPMRFTGYSLLSQIDFPKDCPLEDDVVVIPQNKSGQTIHFDLGFMSAITELKQLNPNIQFREEGEDK